MFFRDPSIVSKNRFFIVLLFTIIPSEQRCYVFNQIESDIGFALVMIKYMNLDLDFIAIV